MPYLGKQPASVPVTADDIPDNSITAAKIVDGGITAADIGADAVGLSELSATGTASTSTFLRGDNAWVAVDTNLVSDNSPQLGGDLDLNSNNITGTGGIPAANLTGTIAAARLDTATTQSASNNSTKIATTAYTDAQVATVVDSAPGTLNTLNELAAALGDDANFSTTVTNSIAAKLPLAGGTMTGTISAASDLVFDAGSDIVLDADGGKIKFRDNGDDIGYLQNTSGDFIIKAITDDKDIKIQGKDGGAFISAVTFDMSEAGYATFNNWLKVNDRVVGNSNLVLNTSDGNEKIHLDASGYIKLETAGAERMRINSSGNVGIGVVPEVWNTVYDGLQIGNTGSLAGYSGSGIDRVWLTANGYVDNNDGSWQYINTDTASQYEQRDGKHNFFVASSGSADATISWANAMTIGNDGRVAISQTGNATAMQVSTSVAAETTAIFQGGGTGAVDVVDVRDSGGNSKFKVRQNGNVGIGHTTPQFGLTLAQGTGDSSKIGWEDGGNTKRASILCSSSTDELQFRTGSSDTERVRIDSSGNVGIGRSPTTDLDLYKSGQDVEMKIEAASNNTNAYFTMRNDDGKQLHMRLGGSAVGGTTWAGLSGSNQASIEAQSVSSFTIGTHGTAPIIFVQGRSEKIRIDTSGRLLINRSSAHSDTQVQINHVGASQYGMYINSTSGGTGTHYHMSWARGDTQCGYMTSSPTTIGINNASDERLKENIQNSASATQSIKNIKVRQFDWKDNRDAHKDYGFVAQELVTVVPEAVAVGSDELKEDGTPVQIWGVDDSKLIPRLVKTIQELEARITALEA